jgi:hypothetical protein
MGIMLLKWSQIGVKRCSLALAGIGTGYFWFWRRGGFERGRSRRCGMVWCLVQQGVERGWQSSGGLACAWGEAELGQERVELEASGLVAGRGRSQGEAAGRWEGCSGRRCSRRSRASGSQVADAGAAGALQVVEASGGGGCCAAERGEVARSRR